MSIQDWMPDFGELTGDFCTDVQTVADGARMVRDLLEPPNGADLRVQRGVMARRVSVARESAYDGLADAMTYLAERQDAPADDSVMRDMAELVRESSGSLREQSAATNALLLAILGEMRTHRRESEVQGNLLAQMVRMTAARGLADEELAGFVRPDTDPGDSWRLDLPGPDGEEPTL